MKGIWKILGGNLVKDVGGIVDDLVTTEEERLQAKQRLEEIFLEAESRAQMEVTDRWEADMKSDNWLSKNIRPLTLIFLTVIFVVISMFDGNLGDFVIADAYKPIYQTLLITVYGAYFAGRSIEKIKS